MMKRIVYIRSSEIYNDSRATKEIIALSEHGFFVDVLAWDRDGKAIELCKKAFENHDNIAFSFFDCVLPNGIGLKNFKKLLSWFKWIRRQLMLRTDALAIHACDFDTGFIVRKVCKKNKYTICL